MTAGQSLMAATSISLQPGFHHFHYVEYNTLGRELNRETGWMPGLLVEASTRLMPQLDFSLQAALYRAELKYIGQTQSGTPISTVSMGEECFPGWTARQNDGKVRLTSGYTNVHVYEITDLDTVNNIEPFAIQLTPELAKASKAFQPAIDVTQTATDIVIPRGDAIPKDPELFKDAPIVIKTNGDDTARVLMRYDARNLYVAWYVFDATPMVNKGEEPRLAFKSGDSVNLFIAPDKDFGGKVDGSRLLITEMTGARRAVLYQPNSTRKKPYLFKSPVREHTYDYVSERPSVRWDIERMDTSYILTATIPWPVLSVRPEPGLSLKADLGVILGRSDTTTHVSQRRQWVDQQTHVVNDVPTESEFFPDRWGTITLGE